MLIEHSTDALKTYYEMGYKAGFKKGVDAHPVKEQLTDEEIDKVIQENKDKCLIDICRAILRKAQENE